MQLVKGLYMTGSSDEDVYCGVIKINTFIKAFFLGQINDLEVAVVGVGNAWLHGFTKKKIYTVAKPRGVVRHIIFGNLTILPTTGNFQTITRE